MAKKKAKAQRSQRWLAAMEKRYQDPNWQAAVEVGADAAHRKVSQDPQWKVAISNAINEMMRDPVRRAAWKAAVEEGRENKLSEAQRQLIIKLYKEGHSLESISRQLDDCGTNKIHRVLKHARVYMTPSARAKWRLEHGIPGRPSAR